jgi:dolichol-phosphate mannosyltransferase
MSRCHVLSLIFPVFNEEEALPLLRDALEAWRGTLAVETEVILVDDGSTDASRAFLARWAADDTSVKVLFLARNFGHQAAMLAGMRHAKGDALVLLDADLQDPLEVVPEMLARFEEGYDIAYGRRVERQGETWFKRATAWGFYRLMRWLVHRNLPSDAGDFRLVSRRCADLVCALPERDPFLRGLFAWTGFRQIGVPYVRKSRAAGTTKFPLWRMLRFASNAALSFSLMPIRVIGVCGLLLAGGSFASGTYAFLRWLVAGDTVQGWPTIVILVAFIGGANMVALAVIGEYVGRVHEAVKQRPRFVVGEALNVAPLKDAIDAV